MHDIGAVQRDDTGEAPRGGEIHLGSRRQRHQVVAFAGASTQHPVGVGHEHGAMSARAQAQHRQEDLLLSAAPGAGRVDVE